MELYNIKLAQLDLIQNTEFQIYKDFRSEFEKIFAWAIKESSQEIKKKAQFDNEIFSFYVKPIILTENNKIEIQLREIFGSLGGNDYPDKSRYQDEQLEYYEKRLHDTSNVFLKVRYSHFLYIYGKQEKKYQYSQILLPNLVEIIYIYQDCRDENSSIFAIACLAEIAISLSNKEMVNTAINLLSSQLDIFEQLITILRCSKITRAVLYSKFSELVPISLSSSIIEHLNSNSKLLFDNKDYLNNIQVCTELGKYEQLKLINKEKGSQLKIEIGKSYELEADFQNGTEEKHPLRKVNWLEKALEQYKNIGHSEKVVEMKMLINQTQNSKEFEESFSTISSNIMLDNENIINFYTSLSLEKNLKNLINSTDFIPNIDEISKEVLKLNELYPLSNLVKNVTFNDGKKISEANTEQESIELNTIRTYDRHLSIIMRCHLQPVIEKLIVEQDLNVNNLMQIFETWGLLDKQNIYFVQKGLERFFSEDYVSSIHILVPQFESSLRRMFSNAGYDTTSLHEGNTQLEITFNEFLKKPYVHDELGNSIHNLIAHVMVEKNGWNLRNEIAHGLIKHSDITKYTCITVIYLFLLLTRIYPQNQSNV